MKQAMNKLVLTGLVISVAALTFSTTASAHVVVKPAEVTTASFQTFTIGVPNEKSIPTTTIKLLIPEGLKHVSPTQKAGWNISAEKEGTGEAAVITSITWSGGTVGAGFRDEFTFSGQVPETTAELQWKAYQTYSDGTIVSWDKVSHGDDHESEDPNSGPLSVTEVVTQTAQDTAIAKTEQAAAEAKKTTSRSLYVAIAGVVVGLTGVFLATRKK